MMKRRMKTFSWRKDLKLNAARCFSGTHADREIYQRNIRDKRLPGEACFDLGDVKVEKDTVTFNEEEDEDTLVEERPQIELGTVFHRDTCHREVHQRTFVQPAPKRVLTWAMSKWAKHIVTFNEERMKTFSWRTDPN